MSRRASFATTLYFAVLSLWLITAPSILSQEQRTSPGTDSDLRAKLRDECFNSSGRYPRRACARDDCPCQMEWVQKCLEWECAEDLATIDERIEKRKQDINEINAYPQMRKSQINPAKDPDMLLWRRRRVESQKACECSKKRLKDLCSLGQEEADRKYQECVGEQGPPYRPYPGSDERDRRTPTGGIDARGGRDRRTPPRRDPLGFPPADAAPMPAPTIVYKPKCDRSLLFINNPEQIMPEDLADNNLGHKTIFETETTGPTRIFFQHTNRTGYLIGYAVQLVNTNKAAVKVTINGRGFVANVNGGEPFRQLFEQKKSPPEVLTVDGGKSIWLIPTMPVQIGKRSFLSGVVDFEARGGPVLIRAFAYRDINMVDGRATYEGYITRKDYDPVAKRTTDESRVYKGTIDCAEVVAEGVDFTIDDNDKPGPIDVQFTPREGGLLINNQWHTHSIRNKDAIDGDMLDIRMPEGIVISAEGVDPSGKVPNLGNWGVLYTLKGHVTNNGSRDRCISIKLQLTDPTETARIAWRDNGGIWRQVTIPARGSIQYYTFPVRAGQQNVPFEASFVLGGPSTTNLLNSISILDIAQSCGGSRR